MSAEATPSVNPTYLSVHRACLTDLKQVQALFEDCTGTLRVRYGIGPWGIATTARQMERNLLHRHVYTIMYHQVCIGSFTLSTLAPHWYPLHVFTLPDQTAMYLSNFHIMPTMQRHGVARWSLNKIYALSRQNGWQSLRGDVFTAVTESIDFATHMGVRWQASVDYASHEHWLGELDLTAAPTT